MRGGGIRRKDFFRHVLDCGRDLDECVGAVEDHSRQRLIGIFHLQCIGIHHGSWLIDRIERKRFVLGAKLESPAGSHADDIRVELHPAAGMRTQKNRLRRRPAGFTNHTGNGSQRRLRFNRLVAQIIQFDRQWHELTVHHTPIEPPDLVGDADLLRGLSEHGYRVKKG